MQDAVLLYIPVLHDFSVCCSVSDNKLNKCVFFLFLILVLVPLLYMYYTFAIATQFLNTCYGLFYFSHFFPLYFSIFEVSMMISPSSLVSLVSQAAVVISSGPRSLSKKAFFTSVIGVLISHISFFFVQFHPSVCIAHLLTYRDYPLGPLAY